MSYTKRNIQGLKGLCHQLRIGIYSIYYTVYGIYKGLGKGQLLEAKAPYMHLRTLIALQYNK